MPAETFSSIKDAVVQCLSQRPEIAAAYIFGSVAAGSARRDSDVDIAVLLRRRPPAQGLLKYRLRLIAEIGSALGRYDIEVIILNEAPPVLAHQVLSKGKLIFERSASERVEFQVRTVNLYCDTEPMRELYRRYLKKRIREGKIFG